MFTHRGRYLKPVKSNYDLLKNGWILEDERKLTNKSSKKE